MAALEELEEVAAALGGLEESLAALEEVAALEEMELAAVALAALKELAADLAALEELAELAEMVAAALEELEVEAEAAVVVAALRRLGEDGGGESGDAERGRLLAFPSLTARGVRELLAAPNERVPCFMMG